VGGGDTTRFAFTSTICATDQARLGGRPPKVLRCDRRITEAKLRYGTSVRLREDMAQLTVETIDQVLDGVIAQRASNLRSVAHHVH